MYILVSPLQNLTPLIFSFELPIMGTSQTIPDCSSPYVIKIQEKYNVQVMFRTRPKLHATLVVVKGCEWEVSQVKEATLMLIRHMCKNLAVSNKCNCNINRGHYLRAFSLSVQIERIIVKCKFTVYDVQFFYVVFYNNSFLFYIEDQLLQRKKKLISSPSYFRNINFLDALMPIDHNVTEYLLCLSQSQIQVQISMEISPQHHGIVLGKQSNNLKMIMQRTATQIMFPDAGDPNIPSLKKSNVTITGAIHNVYLARQQLVVRHIVSLCAQISIQGACAYLGEIW